MAAHLHATVFAALTALSVLGCTTSPGETAEPSDSAVVQTTQGCNGCHGCEEVLQGEANPDTGDSESEGSGEG